MKGQLETGLTPPEHTFDPLTAKYISIGILLILIIIYFLGPIQAFFFNFYSVPCEVIKGTL